MCKRNYFEKKINSFSISKMSSNCSNYCRYMESYLMNTEVVPILMSQVENISVQSWNIWKKAFHNFDKGA